MPGTWIFNPTLKQVTYLLSTSDSSSTKWEKMNKTFSVCTKCAYEDQKR